nr:NTP transferase domain-containing protein [Angustibacter aerolatus]
MTADPTAIAAVVVLAAGEGTRMRSTTPKVLHRIGGRSLLGHAVAAAQGLGPRHLAVVVRHDRDRVAAHVEALAPEAVVADQDEVKGTGRAVQCALDALPDLEGTVVVTYGDVPLLTTATLAGLVAAHESEGDAVTVLTSVVDDPTGYGRVLRADDGSVLAIVEQKDATQSQRAVREINSGIYAFEAAVLRRALAGLTTDNAQGEPVPHRRARAGPRRGRPGRRAPGSATRGRARASTTGCRLSRLGAEPEPPHRRALDARGRHRRRPGHHVGRRRGAARSRRHAAAGHPGARADQHRAGRRRRAGHHARGRRGAGRCHRRPHARQRGGRRRGGQRRPVRVPAARHPARRARQDRHVRRDEERRDRRGHEGAAPVVRR